SLSAILVSLPSHGRLTLQPNGGFTYTPNPGYVGTDSFTYRASNGESVSPIATAVINLAETQDILIQGFYSDGTDLRVSYLVLGSPVGSFKIGLFASPDGVSPGQPLQQIDVTGDYTAPGYHTYPIWATFDDPQEDYYLTAMVDSDNAVPEDNEDNN